MKELRTTSASSVKKSFGHKSYLKKHSSTCKKSKYMKKQGQKPILPKTNDEPQFENKSSKRNLRKNPKKWNDSKNENLILLNENERVEEDIIDEPKDYLKKDSDKKFENIQREIENLKKHNENESL